jgi:LysM repeat protein
VRWRRRFARFLAPVAFLAALTIAVQLVRAGLRTDDEAAPPAATATTAPATTATRPAATRPATTRAARTTTTPSPRFYVIEAGDTLDQVALEHDTTVERLLELNPGVDTGSLQIGQRIRVE